MPESYPKMPDDIYIRVTRYEAEESGGPNADVERISLAKKMDTYLITLGVTNAHVYNVIVHLLTNGKVRLDFRNFVERLELCDPQDRLERGPAMSLIDDFIAMRRTVDMDLSVTQKITIQYPKEKPDHLDQDS